ncbi:MAG: AAA family ATPase [Cystobacterineae bacterium]|nr:AAA family ATPase [Cystobacterineae bacterium]
MSTHPSPWPLASIEVLICVGPGGVGKTTLAAALALQGAALGRKSLVCTIDPAKRLASALGIHHLGNHEALIPLESLSRLNPSPSPAPFWAMMLDMKHAWDELISNHATPSQKTHIFNNRFYHSLSNALAGSQEYIAIEKLWELKMRRDYALLVLDTPPTASALDFLDAPSRLLGFLDTAVSKRLFMPMLAASRWGFGLWKNSNNLLLKTLSRFVGMQTLEQLSDFLLSMGQLYDGFRERAYQTQTLLQAPSTAFAIVTTPHHERISEVQHFLDTLHQRNLQVASILVNQVHLPLNPLLHEELQQLPKPLAKKMERAYVAYEQQASEDARSLQKLHALCPNIPLKTIPLLPNGSSELERLWHISQILLKHPPS